MRGCCGPGWGGTARIREGGGEKEQGDLLGLQVEDLTPQLARRAQVDASTKGVVVTDVAADSPGSEAGFEPGDVIVEVHKQPINSVADYRKAVKSLKKGDSPLLRVKRGQGTVYVSTHIK